MGPPFPSIEAHLCKGEVYRVEALQAYSHECLPPQKVISYQWGSEDLCSFHLPRYRFDLHTVPDLFPLLGEPPSPPTSISTLSVVTKWLHYTRHLRNSSWQFSLSPSTTCSRLLTPAHNRNYKTKLKIVLLELNDNMPTEWTIFNPPFHAIRGWKDWKDLDLQIEDAW